MSRYDDRETWIPAPRRITIPSEDSWFHSDLMFAVFVMTAFAQVLRALVGAIEGDWSAALNGSALALTAVGGAKLNRDFARMRKWTT